MRKLTIFITTLLVGYLLVFPVKTYAFWPFDLFKNKTQNQGTFPPIIEKLIERFNLNKDEVKKTIEDYKTERQNQRRKQIEERLNKAVKDGVITEAQKEALLKKMEEWQNQNRNQREEMRKWLEDSGIDFKKLAPYGIGMFGKGVGKRPFGGRFFGK